MSERVVYTFQGGHLDGQTRRIPATPRFETRVLGESRIDVYRAVGDVMVFTESTTPPGCEWLDDNRGTLLDRAWGLT